VVNAVDATDADSVTNALRDVRAWGKGATVNADTCCQAMRATYGAAIQLQLAHPEIAEGEMRERGEGKSETAAMVPVVVGEFDSVPEDGQEGAEADVERLLDRVFGLK
jgi:hypothetical protein